MAPKSTTEKQEIEIVDLYLSGLSMESVGVITNTSAMIVTRVLRDHSVVVRSCGGVRPYNVNSSAFDNLDNELAAYWLGFLFADAALSRTNLSIGISEKDRCLLVSLAEFLGCEKPLREYKVDKSNIVMFAISDRKLADRLRTLGIEPHRPNSLTTFKAVKGKSKNHFLRGWLDGDGCIYTKPQVSFIANIDFLEAVQKHFIKRGLARRVTIKAPRLTPTRCWGNLVYRGIHRCSAILNYLYQDATIYLDRKYQRFLAWPAPERRKSKAHW